ncbi:unnamed protein product [Urochloa decumbens]|uniref:Uncharacterized protein n=1 Tax=Urochloa decumbens TaxID=240449 RepID=A0ABC8WA74_9POAL
MASRPLLIILLAIVSKLFVMASGQPPSSGGGAITCSKRDGYTDGSQYKKNLDQLLATLPTAAGDNGWFYKGRAGTGADQVFGLIMCFADRNALQCTKCLAGAPAGITAVCPGSRNVSAAYDACLLRYSAAPIPATADLDAFFAGYAYGEPVTSLGLANALLRLMAKLTAGVTVSPLLLANESAPYSSSQEMYGLAQCTRDLNATECTRCINHYVDRLCDIYPNKTGGAMKGYSCYLRYQVGAFQITLPTTMPPQQQPYRHHEPSSTTGLAIGLSIGAACIIVVAALLVWRLHRLRRRKWARILNEAREQELEEGDLVLDEPAMEDEFERGTGPKQFRYGELAIATDNFSDKHKLGKLGSGQIISCLRHRNLVQLIGWCHGGGELLLVYELMPNDSLDTHLYGDVALPWPLRHEIVLGLGLALLYLHQDWEQCVLHRDIKPSNVMLDASFHAKLGDFGLARLVDHDRRSHTTVIAGTMGYMGPECMFTGRADTESDMYSFGVVLLDIACGRRPPVARRVEEEDGSRRLVARHGNEDGEGDFVHIVQWVWEFYGRGDVVDAADARINGEFDASEMEIVMVVGLWCAHPDRSLRPSTRQAVNMLRREAPRPSLPARMPVATFLSPPNNDLYYTSSVATGGSSSTGTTASALDTKM